MPLPNKTDEQIASAVNSVLFQQQTPAHFQIRNAKRNTRDTITAIGQQKATAEIPLRYRDVINNTTRSVNKGVIDVEGNELWERLKIHTVLLVSFIAIGTEVVLATGPGNPPAVRVRTAKTGQFGSRLVHEPNSLLLGGPNPDL